MGNYSDPTYPPYGNNCFVCFPAGKTPKFVHVSFSGIKLGDDGLPGGVEPWPNEWLLEQNPVSSCAWAATVGSWTCIWAAAVLARNYLQLKARGLNYFFGEHLGPCDTWFANLQMLPINPGYDGYGQVVWVPETAASLSIHEIMALIGVEPEYGTMFEFWPTDDSHVVCKFCRTRDATNIKVKVETT